MCQVAAISLWGICALTNYPFSSGNENEEMVQMNKYDKKATKLKKFLHARVPLEARVSEEIKKDEEYLTEYFPNDKSRAFSGVLYYSRTGEVYCTFYDKKKEMAILIPVVDLIFENVQVQKQIENFRKFQASFIFG